MGVRHASWSAMSRRRGRQESASASGHGHVDDGASAPLEVSECVSWVRPGYPRLRFGACHGRDRTRETLPQSSGYRPRWCSMSQRAICWARLEASVSPSVAEMMEPFIRMCQDRANSSGRSRPASSAKAWMWPRMRLR